MGKVGNTSGFWSNSAPEKKEYVSITPQGVKLFHVSIDVGNGQIQNKRVLARSEFAARSALFSARLPLGKPCRITAIKAASFNPKDLPFLQGLQKTLHL